MSAAGASKKRAKVLLVVAAIVLAGAGVFAIARMSGDETVAEGQQLSAQWAQGAHVAWTIPRTEGNPEYPLMASATKLVATTVDESTSGGRTLIAYDITGDQPSEAWTRDLVIDDYFEGDFGFWADYFVYAGQLVDVESGAAVTAPWDDDSKVVVTPGMDTAIACAEQSCAGYNSDLDEVWTVAVEDGVASSGVAQGGDYFVLLYSEYANDVPVMVINAETGEEVSLDKELTGVENVAVLLDGWTVLGYEGTSIVEPSGTVEMLEFTPSETSRMGMTPGQNRTVDDIRWYRSGSNSDAGRIVGQFDEDACEFTVAGKTVNLGDSEGACDVPLQFVSTTQDGGAVAVLVQSTEAGLEYVLVNVDSGEVVWSVEYGNGLRVARPDLAITFDADGINGWAPGS